MDNDSQAVAIGLGAGLGGFAGFVIITCILWHIFCGSWCEKKKIQSIIAPPITRNNQRQRKNPTESIKFNSDITTVTSVNERNVYPDLQSSSPVNQSPR